ncbi:winged helix-turn-helix domain-containing protein [Enterococcus rotai]|uniref:winged helix-turn-helix domain-containing protein n=1 Tax=Enterococcus rotai TaxID=118060 RepID=UPI0035C78162
MYNIGYFSLRKPQNNYYNNLASDPQCSLELIEEFGLDDLDGLDVLVIEESIELNFTNICEWLLEIRKVSDIYILILADEEQMVFTFRMVYLKLGADGIFTEEADELDLIVKNVLKRLKKETIKRKEKESSFEIIPEKSCALVNKKQEVDLTRQEFLVLSILYKNKNQTVTYEDIYRGVWTKSTGEVQKNRVCNLVSHVRKKFADLKNSPVQVKTIRSIGYILDTSLSEKEI